MRALSHLNQWQALEWILSYQSALFPVVLEKNRERCKRVENKHLSASLQKDKSQKNINHRLHVYHPICLKYSFKVNTLNHVGKFWKNWHIIALPKELLILIFTFPAYIFFVLSSMWENNYILYLNCNFYVFLFSSQYLLYCICSPLGFRVPSH